MGGLKPKNKTAVSKKSQKKPKRVLYYDSGLVPKPYMYAPADGYFVINKDTLLIVDPKRKDFAENFRDMLKKAMARELYIHYNKPGYNNILFEENAAIDVEGYAIECFPHSMKISAGGAPGFFYALQSIKQFLRLDSVLYAEELYCPCMVIRDFPKFRYRGFMIDVSRHFFDRTEIKRYIELMSALKFNVFHWHLSDDQGFRFEVDKYPFINITSSERNGDCTGRAGGVFTHNAGTYKGYYTKDDIKDVVAFAKKRFVTVIPEIDMPGHVQAILAAYPNLSCGGDKTNVRIEYGVSREVLCVGKEETYVFMRDILDELFEVFDGPYFHIGGDEVATDNWKSCPHCRKRLAELGQEDLSALQSDFINRMTEYCASKGKIVIGYNDGIKSNTAGGIISQFWMENKTRNAELSAQIVAGGRRFILSSEKAFYCDYPYALTPLKKTYFYELPKELKNAVANGSLLGIEAPLWTEYVLSREKADLNFFPRMLAVAERCWTRAANPEDGERCFIKRKRLKEERYGQFIARVKGYEPILDGFRVNYADLKIADPSNKKYIKAEIKKWVNEDQYSELRMNRNLAEQKRRIKNNEKYQEKNLTEQRLQQALNAVSADSVKSIKIDLPYDKDMI